MTLHDSIFRFSRRRLLEIYVSYEEIYECNNGMPVISFVELANTIIETWLFYSIGILSPTAKYIQLIDRRRFRVLLQNRQVASRKAHDNVYEVPMSDCVPC